nr:sugar phosphate nucleotidyltransferase [Candidatus Sigynarchaeota archaeon]
MASLKAVLLAAGIGKRLQPLTARVPKPLLDIAGKPMIEHTMRFMLDSGVSEFIIVINPAHKSLFED